MQKDRKRSPNDLLQIELKKHDRSGVYGYTQRALAYNSNRIEGSTLTKDQTATLFDTNTLMADGEIIRAKDIEEMTGHFMMFNHMLKTLNEPLSEELIKKFHYNLKAGVFEDMANGYPCGEYKNRVNTVNTLTTSRPEQVEEKISALLAGYSPKSIEDILQFHADYELIRPFQDGNGRTGRIIMFREYLINDITPFIIQNENKAEYIHCLKILQTEHNMKPLLSYIKKEQKFYYDKVIDMILPTTNIDGHNSSLTTDDSISDDFGDLS